MLTFRGMPSLQPQVPFVDLYEGATHFREIAAHVSAMMSVFLEDPDTAVSRSGQDTADHKNNSMPPDVAKMAELPGR